MTTQRNRLQSMFAIALTTATTVGWSSSAVADGGGSVSVSALHRELAEVRAAEKKTAERLRALEAQLKELSEADASEKRAPVAPAPSVVSAPAVASAPAPTSLPSAGNVRLTDLSLNTSAVGGWSSANDEELETVQGGGHDPKRRGFTLQQAELSLGAAVDPYFRSEAHFVFLEGEGVETEEAFVTTTRLPGGLEVEGGYFLTEFGLLNPSHPHAWDWIDQPIVNTRMFGGDGMSGAGLRAGYRLPTPWHAELHLGAQNSGGENMRSFRSGAAGHSHGADSHDVDSHSEESHKKAASSRVAKEEEHHEEAQGEEEHVEHEHEDEDLDHGHAHESGVTGEYLAKTLGDGIGGRAIEEGSTSSLSDLVYLARLENYFDVSETTGFKFGLSSLFGPNTSGRNTFVYGGDLLLKWTAADNFRGYPYLKWQGEFIGREFGVSAVEEDALSLPREELRDYGFYSQLLWGFTHGWATGVRAEYASADGESVQGNTNDPLRDNRLRLSPLVSYRPTEFSRLRLQYNYDRANHLVDEDEHGVWLGVDVLIGTHPAHGWGQS